VTCAFKHGLEMRAIIEDENAEDGVKLRVSRLLASVPAEKQKMKAALFGGKMGDERCFGLCPVVLPETQRAKQGQEELGDNG